MPQPAEPTPATGRPRVRPTWTARARGAERRLRSSGGPVDEATYECGCGSVFAAAVSTQVSCPHCGSEQAW